MIVPRNWDEYYSDPANLDLAPAPLVVEVADLLPPGQALDLACGAGRNALYLASLGWEVTAVDASPVAIRALRELAKGTKVDARLVDLESPAFAIEPHGYDLICDFYYLQRNLFPAIREGLKIGGAFVATIHLSGDTPGAKPHNPDYVLQPGELRSAFGGWKIRFYSEAPEPDKGRPSARIIARRA